MQSCTTTLLSTVSALFVRGYLRIAWQKRCVYTLDIHHSTKVEWWHADMHIIYIYILYRCGFICIYVFVCGNFFETYINIKMHGDMFLRNISFESYTWYLYLWYLCVTSGHTWFKPSKNMIPDRQNSNHGMIWKTCFLEKWWQCCLDPLRSTRVLFFSDQAIDQSRTEIVAATTFMVWSMLLTTVESWAK